MNTESFDKQLQHLDLGKAVEYKQQYTPALLQPVPRTLNRQHLPTEDMPFNGVDIWNGYELSWLNPKGKPQVAVLQCAVPAESDNIIESKSFKLYLNSFNHSSFADLETVQQHIEKDLSQCAAAPVQVKLYSLAKFADIGITNLPGFCIDDLDIEINQYAPVPEVLTTETAQVTETLHSHLLKSNCLITHQPDWGSVLIKYKGNKIIHETLLRYLISFRNHNEFHEHCVERIFCDIMTRCRPEKLTVLAQYTRRGGLDINPFRSNFEAPYSALRLVRQ